MDWIVAWERAMAGVMLAGVAIVAGSAFEASRHPQTTYASACVEDEVRMEGLPARCQHVGGAGDDAWRWLP